MKRSVSWKTAAFLAGGLCLAVVCAFATAAAVRPGVAFASSNGALRSLETDYNYNCGTLTPGEWCEYSAQHFYSYSESSTSPAQHDQCAKLIAPPDPNLIYCRICATNATGTACESDEYGYAPFPNTGTYMYPLVADAGTQNFVVYGTGVVL